MEAHSLYALEERIMAAWSIIDDIRLLAEIYSEKSMTKDEVLNYLLGMETIFNRKFDSLFSQYEELLAEHYQSKKKPLYVSDEDLEMFRNRQSSYE